MRVHKDILLAAAFALVATQSLWSQQIEVPKPNVASYNIVTEEQEIQIGEAVSAQIDKQLPILDDAALTAYVDYLGQKIAGSSQRPNLHYHFKIVNSPEVNAFALPGGFIYINRGILDAAENESELVSVISHEVNHVVNRHGANRLSRVEIVKRIVESNVGPLQSKQVQAIIEAVGGPIVAFVQLKFSRDEEREADLLGLYNMYMAGWNPEGMATFFAKLRAMEKTQPTLLDELLSTHPATAEREEMIRAELKRMPPNDELDTDSLKFTAAKTWLSALPPAPKPKPAKAASGE
jgi:predicted Zn-dependent protease